MNSLSKLSREELLKRAKAQIELERRRSATDPVFFIETFCYTYDPRTRNKDLPFKLYPFQVELVLDLVKAIETGDEDLFIEKSRDMGATWVVLAVITWFFVFGDQFQALLGSRKEDYVDDGTMQTLFPRMDYMLRKCLFPVKYEKHYMKLVNLDNGSTIIGESANANFSRSGRFNVILFDELAFWGFQQSSWEAAGEATPCRIAITTPSESVSYAKALRNSGLVKVITLHWTLHPLKDAQWYEKAKLRKTSEEVARELDINWEGSLTSIVYPEISNAVMGEYPYNPNYPLYVSWDFGLDCTAIQWWQVNPQTGKSRLVDSYSRTDKPIQFFFPFFGRPIDSIFTYLEDDIEAIELLKDYRKPVHYGDPDVEKRAYQDKEMTTTRRELSMVGIYIQTNPASNDFSARKTAVKMMLQEGIEVNDTPRNRMWLESIKQSRYPKRDENSQATTAITKPIHDWTSHHRSCTEYFAVNYVITYDEPYKRERQYDKVTGRLLS